MKKLTLSVDLTECPQCNAPLVKITNSQRICNGCGTAYEFVSEEDEREMEEKITSRAYAEEQGRHREIGRFQQRW